MDQKLSDSDLDRLAEQVASRLPPGQYGDRLVLSRRQLVAIAGGGLSVGALTTLGVDEATAQSVAGQVGTDTDRVDVYGGTVDASAAIVDATGVEHTGELADDGDAQPPEDHDNSAHSETYATDNHDNSAHSLTFVSDGDGTERQIWVIANGASDPAGAGPDDIIFEEES